MRVSPGAALPDDPFREDPRGLDVGRIVEEDQGLERRVRARPLGRALLPARRVEGEEARVEVLALPVDVEPAAVEPVPRVVPPLPRREVEVAPVAGRLIGPRARTADLPDEKPARGERAIPDQLRIETEPRLPREEPVVGILLEERRRRER
jgi:hypothetical protein